MSQEQLWMVVGRAKVDKEFNGRLFKNFRQELITQNYELDDNEIATAQQALSDNLPPSMPPGMAENFAFENKLKQDRLSHQIKRLNDLSTYTVQILKDTLGNAARTYKTITWMNIVMFIVGISLFLFAAIYAVFSKEKVYSLIFGGLGTISFITLFLLGSIEKSQVALSNLVQVEISFMNYFEQISFWETYALMPKGYPPMLNEGNIEKASEMLQLRSKEIIDLLQNFIETKDYNQVSKT